MLPLKKLAVDKKWTYQQISDYGRITKGPSFPSKDLIAQYACGSKAPGRRNAELICAVYPEVDFECLVRQRAVA